MAGRFEKHEKTLLRAFDYQARQTRATFVEELGEDRTVVFERRARDEFLRLVVRIGDIGPIWNYFTWEAIFGVTAVARYRALRSEGLEDDRCALVMYRSYEAVASAVPDRLAAFMRRATHSLPVRLYMRAQARLSRRRRHPDFFVFDYVAGDHEHDWGLDFHECAIAKFCDEVGEADCLPMICTVDYAFGRRLGWGLRRERTISAGEEVCTFRFKRSRNTPDATLPSSGETPVRIA